MNRKVFVFVAFFVWLPFPFLFVPFTVMRENYHPWWITYSSLAWLLAHFLLPGRRRISDVQFRGSAFISHCCVRTVHNTHRYAVAIVPVSRSRVASQHRHGLQQMMSAVQRTWPTVTVGRSATTQLLKLKGILLTEQRRPPRWLRFVHALFETRATRLLYPNS
jgi:hypothetical protein